MPQVNVMGNGKQLGTVEKSENADAALARLENLTNALTAFSAIYDALLPEALPFKVKLKLPLEPYAQGFCKRSPMKGIFDSTAQHLTAALEADQTFATDLLARIFPA